MTFGKCVRGITAVRAGSNVLIDQGLSVAASV